MAPAGPVDVMIISLGSTAGLRGADEQLRDSLTRAGASVRLAGALAPREVRTLMLTDLSWAWAARTAARRMLSELDGARPRALIYSSTTAALLWPRPGAIRFDAPSAANRPGRHGLWQRPLERLRLARAPLLLPWSAGGLRELPAAIRPEARALVLPVAVEPSGALDAPGGTRDIAAVTYAANPVKKGLDRVLEAWRAIRAAGLTGSEDELLVAGVSESELRGAGVDVAGHDGVRVVGALPREEYRALLRRSRLFVCAPRREDYGLAQLEALADGCRLVSTPAPGPYVALPLARQLDPRLVDDDLAAALALALSEPDDGYAARAREALAPFALDTLDALVARELLPRLLA